MCFFRPRSASNVSYLAVFYISDCDLLRKNHFACTLAAPILSTLVENNCVLRIYCLGNFINKPIRFVFYDFPNTCHPKNIFITSRWEGQWANERKYYKEREGKTGKLMNDWECKRITVHSRFWQVFVALLFCTFPLFKHFEWILKTHIFAFQLSKVTLPFAKRPIIVVCHL